MDFVSNLYFSLLIQYLEAKDKFNVNIMCSIRKNYLQKIKHL